MAKDAVTEVMLLTDRWDEEGKRVSAGAVVSVPKDQADALIADGKAKVPTKADKAEAGE